MDRRLPTACQATPAESSHKNDRTPQGRRANSRVKELFFTFSEPLPRLEPSCDIQRDLLFNDFLAVRSCVLRVALVLHGSLPHLLMFSLNRKAV